MSSQPHDDEVDVENEVDSADNVDDQNYKNWILNIQYLLKGKFCLPTWNLHESYLPNHGLSENFFYPTHFSSLPTLVLTQG